MPAIIVLGDKTDHGGEVIEASGVTDTHGRRIARVGDKVHCPKKGHGTVEIVAGDNTMIIDGKAVAYHGCKTSCGATLISSQVVTSVEFGSGTAAPATSAVLGAPASLAADCSSASEDQSDAPFDEQFRAVDAKSGKTIEGLAYFVRVSSGVTYSGFTDAQGLVPRIQTDQAETIQIWFGVAALHMEGASHV
jgi:uncharacterized Zn-binding protein involved in type VI secretion